MNLPPAKGLLQINYLLSEFEPPLFAYYTGFPPFFLAADGIKLINKVAIKRLAVIYFTFFILN
jgi:hypothetical protein